jgi:hypothetical protein
MRAGSLALAVLLLAGCGERDGIVELYWQFDDTKLRRIYPLGVEADTCGLQSQTVDYDLRVRLNVLENTQACLDDPSNVDCQVVEPMLFPCNRPRGTALHVPPSETEAGDPGYLMLVDLVIDPADADPFVPLATCVARPGPRVRQVRAGRITDLEIYEFILLTVDIDGEPLDLDACRPT